MGGKSSKSSKSKSKSKSKSSKKSGAAASSKDAVAPQPTMTSSSPANDKGGTLGASSSAASSSKMGDSDSGSGGGGGWDDQTLLSKTGQKVNKDDFELLTVIGKGSFGKVMQVRKKDDGKIYAMKVLRKEAIIARKQVAHTKAEKSILQKIQHPFIVNLNFAFQTEDKLYMILDYINGGELFFSFEKRGQIF
mmetsp:Transcript_6064/g.9442  ORF Transcript_6064/g.9442 Transcript_6064/m.9442 type:complete len:192 (-) Transcript_6064:834-1409(-)